MIHHVPFLGTLVKRLGNYIRWKFCIGPSVKDDIKVFSGRLGEALDLIQHYQRQVAGQPAHGDFRLFGDAKEQRVMDLIQYTSIKTLYDQYDSKFRTALTIDQKQTLDKLFTLRLNTSIDNAIRIISDAKKLMDSISL